MEKNSRVQCVKPVVPLFRKGVELGLILCMIKSLLRDTRLSESVIFFFQCFSQGEIFPMKLFTYP